VVHDITFPNVKKTQSEISRGVAPGYINIAPLGLGRALPLVVLVSHQSQVDTLAILISPHWG